MSSRAARHSLALAGGLLASACACGSVTPEVRPAPREISAEEPPARPERSPPASRITLAFGGDVNLGRHVGQRLLAVPEYDPFRGVRPFFEDAGLVFVNLESPLSDQGGQTRHPTERNVFTGPPLGARTLAEAGVGMVSLANNHAWDYGLDGFRQTIESLRGAGVSVSGASLTEHRQFEPTLAEVDGWTVAVLSVTRPWNPGVLAEHEASSYVARHDDPRLLAAISKAKQRHDVVLVSVHAGKEYSFFPRDDDRLYFERLVDAGADAVVGHHPHVLQGVAWRRGRPMIFSLGNLVFGVHRSHPWAGRGAVARLTMSREGAAEVALCPFAIVIDEPHRLGDVGMSHRLAEYRSHIEGISEAYGGALLGELDARGCLPVLPGGVGQRRAAPERADRSARP